MDSISVTFTATSPNNNFNTSAIAHGNFTKEEAEDAVKSMKQFINYQKTSSMVDVHMKVFLNDTIVEDWIDRLTVADLMDLSTHITKVIQGKMSE